MERPFHRNKIPIKQWIQKYINDQTQQVLPISIAKYLCLALINEPSIKVIEPLIKCEHNNNSVDIEELWNKNQYFLQCLMDLSEEIIFYVYSFSWKTRQFQPKCLLGLYQLSKNLIHYHNKCETYNEDQIQFVIPQCLKEFVEEKMLRTLLIDWNFSSIKTSLTKLSDSIHTQLFIKQLSVFIEKRLQRFQQLYNLRISIKMIKNLVSILAQELQSKEECQLDIPVDQLFLCFCYATYKMNKQKVLFAKIIQIYQQKFQVNINKTYLLNFYNEVYIMQKIFQISGDSTGIDKNVQANKVLGTPIKQQKSILQLFE